MRTGQRKKIALLTAVPFEGTGIRKRLALRSAGREGGVPLFFGAVGRHGVFYAVSGVGKTNAAHAASVLIQRFAPSRMILFGIGGAYPSSGLAVGDVAVAEKEAYGDEGVLMRDGFHSLEQVGIPLVSRGKKRLYHEFTLAGSEASRALDRARQASVTTGERFSVRGGSFVTVSTSTGTLRRAREIEKAFGAICENMEGAAAAHVCELCGVPFTEVRGISNIVEDRNMEAWDRELATRNCQSVVLRILEDLP